MTSLQQKQLDELLCKLEIWYKSMIEKSPNLNDGESMTIKFSGGWEEEWVGIVPNEQKVFVIAVTTEETNLV